MIKVLGLALYGPLAASTRYRLGQYIPGLASEGIDLQICYLLGNEYLIRRFGGKSLPIKAMMYSGLARFMDLLHLQNYDMAVVHCELFPLFPGWLERMLIRKPYIYDFDDAFYLKYRTGNFKVTNPFLGRKFDTVMAGAVAVTAGNRVLAEYASQYNTNIFDLPTVLDTDRYIPQSSSRSGHTFTIGWIGSPSTARFLTELIEPLSVIGQEGSVKFVVIGGKAPVVPHVEVVEIEWNEHTEVDLINTFDVGVMPLPDDDWARGKCAFKLIQYMACAVPVIASPVGANIEVLKGASGLLAATSQEWVDMLRVLRDQPSKRAEMGLVGRTRIIDHYSLRHNLPLLAGIIREVSGKN